MLETGLDLGSVPATREKESLSIRFMHQPEVYEAQLRAEQIQTERRHRHDLWLIAGFAERAGRFTVVRLPETGLNIAEP